MQYVKMNTTTGVIDKNSLVSTAPTVMEKGNIRWITVVDDALNPWQHLGDLPNTVATNATSCSRSVVSISLASWKQRRIESIRSTQWSKIAALYPIGQIINYYATAIRLTFKKASGNTLTAGETSLMSNIGTALANNVEPISSAADATVAAINAASTHQEVETAYASVAWP